MLFAHLIWNFALSAERQSSFEPLAGQIVWDVGGSDPTEIVIPDNVRVVALVSYIARSRTSILDCYLQSNLAINGGPLDQVIFTPETGYEEDLDRLYALVQSTPGYFMLGKAIEDTGEDHGSVPIEDTQVFEDSVGVGPFAKAWNLALFTSQSEAPPVETGKEDVTMLDQTPAPSDPSISIFIHGENIFIAQDAISQLLKVHLARPSYAFVQANMINQPVLSWIHHHLGVIRPYRPETEPPVRLRRNRTAAKQDTQAKGDNQHPWRASELPLWRDSHRSGDSFTQDGDYADVSAELPPDFPPPQKSRPSSTSPSTSTAPFAATDGSPTTHMTTMPSPNRNPTTTQTTYPTTSPPRTPPPPASPRPSLKP